MMKYRAWDKETNLMIYSDERNRDKREVYYDFIVTKDNIVCMWMEDYDDSFGYSVERHGELDNIMQYTGVTNINGIEIYKDDILYDDVNEACGVVFLDDEDGAWAVDWINENAIESFAICGARYLDVVGNVYENSELFN